MDSGVDVIRICIFKIKDCCLAADVDCSKLHEVMGAVQAFLKVATLSNKGQFKHYRTCEICKSLHPFRN